MTAKQSVWRDLIVAILSTYNISLEKVDNMDFDSQGLTDPSKLVKLDHEALYLALVASGYDRGKLNGIFIPRLQALGAYIQSEGQIKLEKVLAGKDKRAIEQVLLPIKGVGPKVIETYLLLRGLDTDVA